MFFHVSWQVLAEDFCCFQDETELLNRHCRTSWTENSSNSQFLVTNLHLFYLTWLSFCSSVCHQSWKTEKITLHDLHTIQLLDYSGSEPSDLREQEEGKRKSSNPHSSPPLSHPPIFLFVCAFFLDLYVRMSFQGTVGPVAHLLDIVIINWFSAKLGF